MLDVGEGAGEAGISNNILHVDKTDFSMACLPACLPFQHKLRRSCGLHTFSEPKRLFRVKS